jgi:hypothetical protein
VPSNDFVPVKAMVIDYEQAFEPLIVEIIGRLDEIGDEVDGVISEAERKQMITKLES